jgi:folate-dependent phosphoribosylglycinamide formyltransferase PurN
LRKVGQWGLRDSYQYAITKLGPQKSTTRPQIRNPYLEKMLRHGDGIFRSLGEVAHAYRFPVATCSDQNSTRAVSQLRQWSPDLAVFTGGDILRDEALKICRVGVLNSHLALLPEIRGMSSPEWSLLCGVPLGITIHLMDSGIDTGPIVLRREFKTPGECDSLVDLRNRMISDGIELIAEAVSGFERGTISTQQQPDRGRDSQFFVMHDQLKTLAARRLRQTCMNPAADPRRLSGAFDA